MTQYDKSSPLPELSPYGARAWFRQDREWGRTLSIATHHTGTHWVTALKSFSEEGILLVSATYHMARKLP
jgi:hypothetical protein